MIVEFENEFERIAGIINTGFTVKKISELEDFVQGYAFTEPLLNFVPMESFETAVGASGQITYDGTCVLQFLTKAVKSDNYERVKNVLIDQMILKSEAFYRELNLNASRVFIMPQWTMRNTIKRMYTSNYLVGIESTVTFKTSCARL